MTIFITNLNQLVHSVCEKVISVEAWSEIKINSFTNTNIVFNQKYLSCLKHLKRKRESYCWSNDMSADCDSALSENSCSFSDTT